MCVALDNAAGSGHRKVIPRKRPPKGGDRQDARCIASFDIVHRVPDENRFMGRVSQAVERGQYGLRIRFVSRASVATDNGVEVFKNTGMLETAACQCVCLTRD